MAVLNNNVIFLQSGTQSKSKFNNTAKLSHNVMDGSYNLILSIVSWLNSTIFCNKNKIINWLNELGYKVKDPDERDNYVENKEIINGHIIASVENLNFLQTNLN